MFRQQSPHAPAGERSPELGGQQQAHDTSVAYQLEGAFDEECRKIDLTGAWEKVARRHYIRCEGFQIAHGEPTIAKVEADPSWTSERWPDGHSPHITAPAKVVAAIQGRL